MYRILSNSLGCNGGGGAGCGKWYDHLSQPGGWHKQKPIQSLSRSRGIHAFEVDVPSESNFRYKAARQLELKRCLSLKTQGLRC